jgi:hypothetical protein
VTSVAGHAALVVAVLAVGAAALRIAAAAGARAGLELAVAAAPVGAAIAALWAIGLGAAAALGGSPVALLAGALVTWAAARRRLPPAPRIRLPRTAWLGVAVGAGAVWVAWLVENPGLAIDPLTYHLPESVMWVQQGTPGSIEAITYEFPQGSYPVTNEVLVAWLMGLGRSFAPALLWTPAMGVLLAGAAWLGLRRLRATPWATALAIAAVLLVPVAATQFLGPHTDLPALAWLVCAAALATRRETLGPAVLAACLAIGTKTTVAPLALIVVAAALWPARRRLPVRALSLALAAGAVVGGAWYARNLVDHGSPLWPFVAAPWGDPLPPFLDRFDVSFLDRPAETLRGRTGIYLDLLGGGLLILAGGLLGRWWAAAAMVVAALAWAQAPFTGAPEDAAFLDLSLTTTRYLVPAMAAGAAALALRRHGWATAILAAGALLSLDRSLALPFPGIPSLPVLLAGAVAGAVLIRIRIPRPVLAVGAVLALSVAAHGFAARHGGIGRLASSGVVTFMAGQRDADPVAFAPQMLAVLAGDDLRRPLELIAQDEPCDETRARRGWIVVGTFPLPEQRAAFSAGRCLARERPVYADRSFRVYRHPR